MIQLDGTLTTDRTVTVRACLAGKYCNDATAQKGDREVFVPIAQLSGPDSVSLTLSALVNGGTITTETVSVAPKLEEPNGRSCDPKLWIVAVHLTAGG